MKKRVLIIGIVISLLLILSIFLYIKTQNNSALNKNYLEDQIYCEKDSDCIENMPNCQLPIDIFNCKNKYYAIPKETVCAEIDIGIRPEDKCLCDTLANKCKIYWSNPDKYVCPDSPIDCQPALKPQKLAYCNWVKANCADFSIAE